jgi:hypothetical protein
MEFFKHKSDLEDLENRDLAIKRVNLENQGLNNQISGLEAE